MSVDQKIGQLLMLGFTGVDAEDADRLIQTYQPGAIAFLHNTQTPAQTQALSSGLQHLAAKAGAGVPLLIAVDHEGGQVQRLTNGVTHFPPMQVLGATYDMDLADLEGEVQGRELHALGINMNLGPVLDVDSNPSNPIIGAYQRSLGADPGLVGSLGRAYIQGLQSQGVIAVAKHFPGHGATTTDSHVTLPSLPFSQVDLANRELVPFRQVAPEVGGVMMGHILFPNIDARWPASLSPTFVQHVLRDELGFDRLVMTDDLAAMAAITNSYDAGTAAVQAILAGNDLVVIASNPQRQAQAVAALRQAVQTGKLPMAQVDASVRRVLQAKADYGVLDAVQEPATSPEPDQAAVQRVAEAAITVVRDPTHQLPLPPAEASGVVISTSSLLPASGGTRLGDQVRQRRPGTREFVLRGGADDISLADQALLAARQAAFVVVATADGGAAQQPLVSKLRAAGVRPIVIEFSGPSGLPALPQDIPYIAAYAPQPELVDAAVKELFGEIQADGRLPIKVGAAYPVGSSVAYPSGSTIPTGPATVAAPTARNSAARVGSSTGPSRGTRT